MLLSPGKLLINYYDVNASAMMASMQVNWIDILKPIFELRVDIRKRSFSNIIWINLIVPQLLVWTETGGW